MNRKSLIAILIGAVMVLAGCTSDAGTASRNLSTAADQFEINRQIVFYNGITEEYIAEIEGRCSIASDNVDGQLEVTCRTGPEAYVKHFLGLSDNVTYFVLQSEPASADAFRHRIIFKPQSIIPNLDLETRAEQNAEAEEQTTE